MWITRNPPLPAGSAKVISYDLLMAGKQRLAVMLSGSGRTLANLLERIARGELEAEVALVIASRDCPGAERAQDAGIPTVVIPGVIPETTFEGLLREHRIDWVVLAGYLKLLPIPDAYRGRIVNIHPALLPDFGGPGMFGDRVHEAVLNAGCTESGCTVHLCDEEFDRGDIVLQRRVPVIAGDTVRTLADRVFAEECEAYPEALRKLFAAAPAGPSVRQTRAAGTRPGT
jgi:phosphoribosylglycinamide formyltransferase-1